MEVKLSFGQKVFILSLFKLIVNSKTSFAKVVHYGMLFENVKKTVILSQAYQRLISATSHTNLRHIVSIGISHPYLVHIFGIKHVLEISQTFLRHITDI